MRQLSEAWDHKVQQPAYPDIVWKLLLARWVELDPESAIKCQKRLNYWSIRRFCEETWLDLDYETALAFFLNGGEPDYRMLMPAVARRNPQLALQWVKEDPQAAKSVRELMDIWCVRDTEAAISATEELSGRVKSTALRAIIKQVAEKSPQRAMGLVDQLESVNERETAMKELLGAMGRMDPESAAREIAALPETRLKAEVFAEFVKTKCQTNPEAAWEWAKGLAEPQQRHQAIHLAAERLAKGDPEKLLSLFEETGWEYARLPPQSGESVRHPGGSSSSGHGI